MFGSMAKKLVLAKERKHLPTKHGAHVIMQQTTTFNIDGRQMGVGGDTSWGRLVHPPYTIKPISQAYGFSLIPVTDIKNLKQLVNQ